MLYGLLYRERADIIKDFSDPSHGLEERLSVFIRRTLPIICLLFLVAFFVWWLYGWNMLLASLLYIGAVLLVLLFVLIGIHVDNDVEEEGNHDS